MHSISTNKKLNISKRRPAIRKNAIGCSHHHSSTLRDSFDSSASNFARFNAHYPPSLREYFHRPRTATTEIPRRLGKVKHHFECLSTYGLKSDTATNLKTQLHFLRADPAFQFPDRSLSTLPGKRNNICHVAPWDTRHSAHVSRPHLTGSVDHHYRTPASYTPGSSRTRSCREPGQNFQQQFREPGVTASPRSNSHRR